jgi:hypothetical protein
MRKKYNDWDFSISGRLRQANRIAIEASKFQHSLIDFTAPLKQQHHSVKPDVVIWMNTIKHSKFADTDAIFTKPDKPTIIITDFNYNVVILSKLVLDRKI